MAGFTKEIKVEAYSLKVYQLFLHESPWVRALLKWDLYLTLVSRTLIFVMPSPLGFTLHFPFS